MKAALYARTGTTQHSTKDQLHQCRQYSRKKGWEVVGIYQDEGVSAHELERSGLKQMLLDAQLRKFDLIIIARYDRLYRSQTFIDNLLTQLYAFDVVVVVAN
jgi:site-specific DNA recombinase